MIEKQITQPSNRAFGIFVTAVFLAMSLYFLASDKLYSGIVALGISLTLGVIVFLKSELLSPLNKLWTRLAILLGKIVSPIVIGSIFVFLIPPVAILSRLFGRDELVLKFKSYQTASYWVERKDKKIQSDSFKNQF